MLLDHDLGGEQYVSSELYNTGAEFCRWLVKQEVVEPTFTLIHSFNPGGAEEMQRTLLDAGWSHVVRWPFGRTVLDVLRLKCLQPSS